MIRTPLSSVIFFVFCLVYGSGFYALVQSSVVITFLLTLAFPVLFWPLVQNVNNSGEIKRILLLESGFNLLCFLAVSLYVSIDFIDAGLIAFFTLQSFGFIAVQLRKRAYISVLISVCLTLSIALWIVKGVQTSVGPLAELNLFGVAVPWQLKLIYGAWLMQLLFVEYRHVLPKIALAVAHIASYTIAVLADDFFHARIVTASHLLFLTLCFDIKSMAWGGRDFAIADGLSRYVKMPTVHKSLSLTLLVFSVITLGTFFV
ncbi:hypothetical protein SAMN02745132_03618 [Enterovibrio nigricans DSM 22720]|uniref:Uncharacterized protein n=1 Tax=Enterovibrio nigricans DSM 22720 TaxID=1121868 RepID=A0A1T4VBU0_9GAMM|nr:hypothetical protein SAMN02745132_03618 [Enterovibrio nigricans DSM 22720]